MPYIRSNGWRSSWRSGRTLISKPLPAGSTSNPSREGTVLFTTEARRPRRRLGSTPQNELDDVRQVSFSGNKQGASVFSVPPW